ncbi:hypothetical protein FRC98_15535 [Lujinxingia vulgaris]|uniref:Uncharacterized protein n=1 Tax=Lujinxingia vulgaris TaxID=2600176 RepID=A0A5C6XBY8_9DELT|nr:hypothetical protein [Lujinxingia vulgaris]TXD35618.1 hypothetical protein FRC98_15535 [Lujinxingia vulgaris]
MNQDQLEHKLIPYVLTTARNLPFLDLEVDIGRPLEVLRVEDDQNGEFCSILNRSNQEAFGGPDSMGMPLWVMLDCAILPSAVIGFMLPRADTPPSILEKLDVDDDYEGFVPISEYCACPTVEADCVSGFSLHSHLMGQGIATRTKALALAIYKARYQVGVTQFYNPAIRVHVRFGAMEMSIHRPSVHTYPEDSFVYRLELPSREVLINMARGADVFGQSKIPEGVRWEFDPNNEMMQGRLARHLQEGGRAWLIPPGWRASDDGCELHMVLDA